MQYNFFFLEHAGELRINILRRKGEKIPKMLQKWWACNSPKNQF